MSNRQTIPAYRFHKASGQAVVVLGGRSVYLGLWNTPESKAKYGRTIAEWLATRAQAEHNSTPAQASSPDQLTIDEMLLTFWRHAERYYVHADGTPTGELENFRHALRPLRKLYGATPARDFGPIKLKAVRETMIRADLARKTINARINRIRRVFSWAVSEERLPVDVLTGLRTLAPLKRGRCQVRESKGMHPVAWTLVEKTVPYLPKPVAAMIQIMRVPARIPGTSINIHHLHHFP